MSAKRKNTRFFVRPLTFSLLKLRLSEHFRIVYNAMRAKKKLVIIDLFACIVIRVLLRGTASFVNCSQRNFMRVCMSSVG